MSCTSTTLRVETDSSSRASSTARDNEQTYLFRRGRRHSYDACQPRRHERRASTSNADAIYFRVDLFLREMKFRVDQLERYRQEHITHFNEQLERGYQAMKDVRDSCSRYSEELLWGAAKQRVAFMVETLETRYKDIVPDRTSLEQKAQDSMKVMETWLVELESKTTTRRKELMQSGWRAMDNSITSAVGIFEDGIDKAQKAKEALKESISQALMKASQTRLIRYEDLPVPWQSNPHIVKGYRFTESKIECLVSILRPSNETVNIWSHLIGVIVVLSLAFFYYPSSAAFTMSSKWDILVAACFFAAACKCLICSTVWHTMNSIADQCLLDRFACVDYTGISLLVAASIMSSEWTAFYCDPVSRTIYMTLTVCFGIAGLILPWRESFNRPDMAWARVAFYVSLSATGFAPVIQLNLTRGPAWTYYFYAPITKSVLVYLSGAVIYASKVPEKWFPGLFDYAGASHNIWHLAVLGGIFFHYTAMMEFFQTAFRIAEMDGCAASGYW